MGTKEYKNFILRKFLFEILSKLNFWDIYYVI